MDLGLAGRTALVTGGSKGMGRAIAELGPQGVNVTVVHPGFTVTERTPGVLAAAAERRGTDVATVERSLGESASIGRLVTAAEVADVVTFLAGPRSVAINGDVIAAGGGAPGAIHY